MIAVDETFLSLLFYPNAKPPDDPATGKPIERLQDRIDQLIDTWQASREIIVIPTPVLTEFLYLAGEAAPDYLSEIDNKALYKSGDFDRRAAVELAALHHKFAGTRSKRRRKSKGKDETWAKISFDRQIVAICKVNNVTTIYSDDGGLRTFAIRNGIEVVRTWELPMPPMDKQMGFEELLEGQPATDAKVGDVDSKAKVAEEGDLSENGS